MKGATNKLVLGAVALGGLAFGAAMRGSLGCGTPTESTPEPELARPEPVPTAAERAMERAFPDQRVLSCATTASAGVYRSPDLGFAAVAEGLLLIATELESGRAVISGPEALAVSWDEGGCQIGAPEPVTLTATVADEAGRRRQARVLGCARELIETDEHGMLTLTGWRGTRCVPVVVERNASTLGLLVQDAIDLNEASGELRLVAPAPEDARTTAMLRRALEAEQRMDERNPLRLASVDAPPAQKTYLDAWYAADRGPAVDIDMDTLAGASPAELESAWLSLFQP